MKTSEVLQWIEKIDPYKRFGKVTRMVGLLIESKGPETSIGDVCYIYTNQKNAQPIMAEVVGFQQENVLLMPLR